MFIPSNIKALILDMDGVLWKADTPIGDLSGIFKRLASESIKVVYATNNGTLTPEQYARKIKNFGVRVDASQIVTSSLCAARLLREKIPQGAFVYVIGETGIIQALKEEKFSLVPVDEAEKAQAVVISLDRQITFEKVREAALLVRKGVPFFATNPDKTFPTPRGEIPGAGAWASVIVTATGVEPVYAGKPFPYLMELALARLGTRKEDTLVVGDRLETDIAAGQSAGLSCALVLSGVSTREQAESWNPKIDVICQDLAELVL